MRDSRRESARRALSWLVCRATIFEIHSSELICLGGAKSWGANNVVPKSFICAVALEDRVPSGWRLEAHGRRRDRETAIERRGVHLE